MGRIVKKVVNNTHWSKREESRSVTGANSEATRPLIQTIAALNPIPLELPVSLPLVKVNGITLGDSLELTGCVPAKADLILEDMPYNMTACNWDKEPIDLKRYWESRLELIKPTGVICLTASQPFTSDLVASNRNMFKYEWIWEKDRATGHLNAKIMPMKAHENILIFYKSFGAYKPIKTNGHKPTNRAGEAKKETDIYNKFEHYKSGGQTDRYPRSVIKFNVHNSQHNIIHPAQKPVGLFEYLIRTYTNEGDLVFDGFGGSGTTAIAAHRSKRNFIVIEKDKRYFEIASKRLYQERNPLSTFDEAS